MLFIYKVLFFTGLIYAAVTFVLGSLLDFADIDGDFDFEGDLPISIFFPIKPITVVPFITTFGGLGWIGILREWNIILTNVIAFISAYILAMLLYRFLVIPLKGIETKSEISEKEAIGKRALIISSILENGYGSIKYSINDNSFTAPAKNIDGEAIKQGEEVLICKIEDSVYYVSKLEKT